MVLLALTATPDFRMSEVSHVGENDRRLSPLDQMADDEWITLGDDQRQ